MATLDSMLISLEEYTLNSNAVKEMVLQRLCQDGVITDEQASEYADKWQVIVIKPAWFERWIKKFNITNKENYRFKYVKFED